MNEEWNEAIEAAAEKAKEYAEAKGSEAGGTIMVLVSTSLGIAKAIRELRREG